MAGPDNGQDHRFVACVECGHPGPAHAADDGVCSVCCSGLATGQCAMCVYFLANGPLVADAFARLAGARGSADDVSPVYVFMAPRSVTADVAVQRVVEALGLSSSAAEYVLTDTTGHVLHGDHQLGPWDDQVLLLGSR